MRNFNVRLITAVVGSLLVVCPVYADGGISALGGLLDMLLLFIGTIGLFIIALMFAAISSRKRKPRSSIGVKVILGLSMAYVLLAMFFFVMSIESPFRIVPAITGSSTIVLLCVYAFRFNREGPK